MQAPMLDAAEVQERLSIELKESISTVYRKIESAHKNYQKFSNSFVHQQMQFVSCLRLHGLHATNRWSEADSSPCTLGA